MGKDWPDDRLDDLDGHVRTQAEAITYLSLKVNTLEAQMQNLKDEAKARTESRVNWWIIMATISNSLTGIVVYLISKGVHP